jgi:hypothetical protein
VVTAGVVMATAGGSTCVTTTALIGFLRSFDAWAMAPGKPPAGSSSRTTSGW